MQFRPTNLNEVDAAFEIIEQARRRIAELGIDQWQSGRPSRESIAEDAQAGEGYVVDDGGPIATAMLTSKGEKCYDELAEGTWLTSSMSSTPSYLTVHRFAVSDAALGKGVAKFMLSESERIARDGGLESVRIDTHEGNTRMCALLESCGYARCGILLLDEAFQEPTRERVAYEKLV